MMEACPYVHDDKCAYPCKEVFDTICQSDYWKDCYNYMRLTDPDKDKEKEDDE